MDKPLKLTQITYKKAKGGAHMFMGSDRISNGLFVGDKDLETAYNQIFDQMEKLLHDNHEIRGKVKSAVDKETLFEHLNHLDVAMLTFIVDTW